jgi:hypothetical protein
MAKTLNEQNLGGLLTVLIANFSVFVVLITTHALAVPGLASDPATFVKPILPAGIALIICGMLNRQVDSNTKARIVYWRLKDPLPGSEAFSKYGPEDSRINMTVIANKLTVVPTSPHDQNSAWFSLYKKVQNEPSVLDAHKTFLLYRDYTFLSLLFLILLSPIAFWRIGPQGTVGLYTVLLIGQYLLARNAAAERGRRLVTNVLAEYMVE